jgi:hypothetical protein
MLLLSGIPSHLLGCQHGKNWRRLDQVDRTSSGKKRSAKQFDAAVQALWEAKRDELVAELPDSGDTVFMSGLFGSWIASADSADNC